MLIEFVVLCAGKLLQLLLISLFLQSGQTNNNCSETAVSGRRFTCKSQCLWTWGKYLNNKAESKPSHPQWVVILVLVSETSPPPPPPPLPVVLPAITWPSSSMLTPQPVTPCDWHTPPHKLPLAVRRTTSSWRIGTRSEVTAKWKALDTLRRNGPQKDWEGDVRRNVTTSTSYWGFEDFKFSAFFAALVHTTTCWFAWTLTWIFLWILTRISYVKIELIC